MNRLRRTVLNDEHFNRIVLGIFLILVFLSPLLAQTAVEPKAATVTATPAPAAQAPDDVLKKLSDLIHAGKYVEAQKLTAALLLAYPDDQRLAKAKTLLDKLVASSKPASESPSISQPAIKTAVAAQAPTSTEQLTGIDKVEFSSLIELVREAQRNTDLEQQTALLKRFMDESSPFLQKHPREIVIWQLRAASALSLNDIPAGYEAGQKLLASGLADNDPNMQRVLSQLNLKGWLNRQKVEAEQKQQANEKQFGWLLGIWKVSWSWKPGRLVDRLSNDRGKELFELSGSKIEGYEINSAGVKSSQPDLEGTILDSEVFWKCNLPQQEAGSDLYVFHHHGIRWTVGNPSVPNGFVWGGLSKEEYYPFGWQAIISREISNNETAITMVIPSQSSDPKSSNPSKWPVTLHFEKAGTQDQQGQSQN